MKIETHGSELLLGSFAQLRDNLDDPELLAGVARLVQRTARSVAPKRTGRLASSIGIRRITRGELVRTSLDYAQYVHYGSIHNPRPVPFLEIAARRVDPQAGNVVDDRVSREIGRAGL